ncbi:MAG: ECs_2282 family putative zinc-binding protein [Chloroflexota bacterium]
MDEDKYGRSVTLLCSTCGSDQFAFDDESDSAAVTCANCGRQTTRDELIRENSENIELHVADIGEEATADSAKKLNKSLRDAFKGNKNIRFK